MTYKISKDVRRAQRYMYREHPAEGRLRSYLKTTAMLEFANLRGVDLGALVTGLIIESYVAGMKAERRYARKQVDCDMCGGIGIYKSDCDKRSCTFCHGTGKRTRNGQ